MTNYIIQESQKMESRKVLENLYPDLKHTLDKLYRYRDSLKSVRTTSDYSIGRYVGIDDAIRIIEETIKQPNQL